MCNAVSYIRVSTESQVKNGEGLNIQRQEIENYCKKNKINLKKTFVDEAQSGGNEKRQGIYDLLEYTQNNKIDKVIVYKIDRLSRDTMYGLFVRKELKKVDVELLSIKEESLSGNDPMAELMNTIVLAFATFEKNTISDRMLSGRKEKAKTLKQKASGNCPFGYIYEYNSQGKQPKVIINGEQTKTVKAMFKLYLNDNYSLQKIANYLNENGIKTTRGNVWSKQAVKVVLSNEFYTGALTFGDIEQKGEHEAIINKIIFGKVQAALHKNDKHKNK